MTDQRRGLARPLDSALESPNDRDARIDDGYGEWKEWRAADFGRIKPDESLYFERELLACGVGRLAGLRVGELGYGNGAFAGWARDAGADWVGRERSPALHARAIEAGFEVLAPDSHFSAAWGRSAVDLIVAFDVVEHLDLGAIRSFLQDAKDALRPGGLLVLRVPSGDSPFASAIYRGDVTHRTLLGSSAVRQLACEIGLDVRQIRSPVLPALGLSKTQFVRRIAVRFARWITFAFIRTALMGNKTAVLSPNMVVVLARIDDNCTSPSQSISPHMTSFASRGRRPPRCAE